MRGLDGKTALVTGGANGIGLAICRRLAEAGCSIIMMDMNGAAAEAACRGLSSSSATVVPLITDVSNYDAVRASINKLAADRQKIDIVVNNAGWDRFMPFVDTTPAMWSKVIGIRAPRKIAGLVGLCESDWWREDSQRWGDGAARIFRCGQAACGDFCEG